MTTHEIIDYVVNHFTNNERSIKPDTNICLYDGPNGAKCAFALLCNDLGLANLHEGWGVSTIKQYHGFNFETMLKPEFAGKSTQFYADLQLLHDAQANWTNKALTESGQAYVAYMKSTYIEL